MHQLVQAGLLGNDKNVDMFPFATLRWAQWKNAIGKINAGSPEPKFEGQLASFSVDTEFNKMVAVFFQS